MMFEPALLSLVCIDSMPVFFFRLANVVYDAVI